MTKVITVTRRNGDTHEVIVDKGFNYPGKISISASGHAVITQNSKTIYLHRFILGVNKDCDLVVDHINRNPLDNRSENLRLITKAENAINKISKGYTFHKKTGKWNTKIKRGNKISSLGLYKTEEEAYEVYKKAHADYHKELSPYYKEMVKR
jgi:hypothetical protein